MSVADQYRRQTEAFDAHQRGETSEQQRARMEGECRSYAERHNPPSVVRVLRRLWGRG